MRKPTLAIISQTIRRDLETPLGLFKRLRIVHFYHDAAYGDMKKADFASQLVKYESSKDFGRKLAEIKPDIIQGPEPYASRISIKNCWAVYRYAKRHKVPYFFPVFENRPTNDKFGPVVGRLVQAFTGLYGNRAAGIINLNAGAKKNLLAAGINADKITRLNWGTWGIDLDEFKPQTSLRSKTPLVFFVGRVSRAKGVWDIIEAWPQILKGVPSARLVVAGPMAAGAEGEELSKAVKTLPSTQLIGVIKNADLPDYFAKAWVTVAPSITTKTWEEQVGMINLQSLACETPVVTTKSGAIEEYVGKNHGARLVNEQSPNEIAHQVIDLLGEPSLIEKEGRRGRLWILQNYDLKDGIVKAEEYVLSLFRKHER